PRGSLREVVLCTAEEKMLQAAVLPMTRESAHAFARDSVTDRVRAVKRDDAALRRSGSATIDGQRRRHAVPLAGAAGTVEGPLLKSCAREVARRVEARGAVDGGYRRPRDLRAERDVARALRLPDALARRCVQIAAARALDHGEHVGARFVRAR